VLLLEEAATRDSFVRAAEDTGLVHIATHGLYRADNPAFSYLELADGRLEAFDIAQLELNAATVVLSACETGVGHLTGNELLGLVRAFLYAGARSVLATQWVVDDETTAALVTDVAQRLVRGRAITQALHEAQAAWLAMYSGTLLEHPSLWVQRHDGRSDNDADQLKSRRQPS
jgi:CHAT domain-containing protein